MPEELKTWLLSCPGLSGLTLDAVSCGVPGLYPMEKETLWRRKNVLGGEKVRSRIRFALRAVFPDLRDEGAAWQGDTQQWLLSHEPGFGEDEAVKIIAAGFRGEKGGLIEYTITAAVEFTCRQ